EEDSIDIKKVLGKLLDKWLWFVIAITICLITAFLYGKFTAPEYQITAKVLINSGESGVSGGSAGTMMDFGSLMNSKSSVDNEMEILKTRNLMSQVVKELQLNVTYYRKSGLVKRELYDAPFKIDILNPKDTISYTNLEIEKLDGNKLRIRANKQIKEVNWGEKIEVFGVGNLIILPNRSQKFLSNKYYCNIMSVDDKVATLQQKLVVAIANKQASVIDLGLVYSLPKRGEDILNALISNYTQENLSDKNAIADSTSKFIKERLSIIAAELGDVEDKVENYKKENKLADMSEQGKLLVKNSGEFSVDLAKVETQISILNDLESYLKDEGKNKRVYPTSILPSDMVFSELLNQYNSLLIERDKQLLSVTEESPF
ncbi:MAG: capsular biosynthesis protein, partial [Flavobacterium sp.]